MDAARRTADQGDEAVEEGSRLTRPNRDDPTRAARWAAWQAENAEAIEESNRWYAEHGHPLKDYKMF